MNIEAYEMYENMLKRYYTNDKYNIISKEITPFFIIRDQTLLIKKKCAY
jgi:hypothetical protein